MTSRLRILAALLIVLIAATGVVVGQGSFTVVAAKVNPKLVKLFGAGGFKGLPSYGTGVLISPKGYILTLNNHILTTSDLRVHVYDGRAFHAKVIAHGSRTSISRSSKWRRTSTSCRITISPP